MVEPDDDSLKELDESLRKLNDSIDAFERARDHRRRVRPGAASADDAAQTPGRQRRLPWIIVAVGLLVTVIYFGRGAWTDPTPAGSRSEPAASLDQPDPVTAPTSFASSDAALGDSVPPPDAQAERWSADGDVTEETEPAVDTELTIAAPDSAAGETAATTRLSEAVPAASSSEVPTEVSDDRPEEEPSRAPVQADTVAAPPQPGRYAIQVAAYDRRVLADAMAERLAAKDYPAYVAESENLAERTVFRVRIGAYSDQQAAEAVGRQLNEDEGLDWYVLRLLPNP